VRQLTEVIHMIICIRVLSDEHGEATLRLQMSPKVALSVKKQVRLRLTKTRQLG